MTLLVPKKKNKIEVAMATLDNQSQFSCACNEKSYKNRFTLRYSMPFIW